MVQNIKQRSGIKVYVMRLSLELFARLGKQHHYSAEQVTQTVYRAGFPRDYLPCAHAVFCQRRDFRRYYKRSEFRECYETLRDNVSKRCFGGVRDFDAANIIDAARSLGVKRESVVHHTHPVKKRFPILLGFLAAVIPAVWISVLRVGHFPGFVKAAVDGPAEKIGGLLFPQNPEAALAITYALYLGYCAVFGLCVGYTCGIVLKRHKRDFENRPAF